MWEKNIWNAHLKELFNCKMDPHSSTVLSFIVCTKWKCVMEGWNFVLKKLRMRMVYAVSSIQPSRYAFGGEYLKVPVAFTIMYCYEFGWLQYVLKYCLIEKNWEQHKRLAWMKRKSQQYDIIENEWVQKVCWTVLLEIL